jgi:hypothetical protein
MLMLCLASFCLLEMVRLAKGAVEILLALT